MSTKTVTIRQSCVAPSLVHASCWQAQVGHPETTGHRPSHAGWGPVGVECHLGWSQILVGRFPCNGYEHIQLYTTTTENGVVLCYDVQPDCFFNSEKQPEINTHMEPEPWLPYCLPDVWWMTFSKYMRKTPWWRVGIRHGKYIYPLIGSVYQAVMFPEPKRYLMDQVGSQQKK